MAQYSSRAPTERQDVSGGVPVSVHDQTARRTSVNAIREGLGNRCATATAADAGASGIHGNRPGAGAFCLALESSHELPPGGILHGGRKPPRRKSAQVEIFEIDTVVSAEEIRRELPGEVDSLVSDMLMGLLDEPFGLSTGLGTPFLSGECLLAAGQEVSSPLEESGVFNLGPVREGGKGREPDVDSHGSPNRLLFRSLSHVTGEGDPPFPGPKPDPDIPNFPSQLAVLPEPDETQLRNPEPLPFHGDAADSKGIEAIAALEAGIAGNFPALHASEETFEGTMELPEGRTADFYRDFFVAGIRCTQLGEFLLLVKKADPLPGHAPEFATLLKRHVVEHPATFQPPQKKLSLMPVGLQRILVGPYHAVRLRACLSN
jgi:hypothetical protein